MRLPGPLAKTSPITLGLLVVLGLWTVVRLAVARPTTPRLAPAEERKLELERAEALVEVQPLSSTRALATLRGKGGSWLLDWSRAELVDQQSRLAELELFAVPQGRVAVQAITTPRGMMITRGTAHHAWRWILDEERRRPEKHKLPRDFLWLRPDGKPFTLRDLQVPEGWLPPHPASTMTSGHLALARPRVEVPVEDPKAKTRTGKPRTRVVQGNEELLLFDAQTGRGLARIPTDKLRTVFTTPGWTGFAWNDDSSSWMQWATCDEAGQCRSGTSMMRLGAGTIRGAHLRHDIRRLAACTTRHAMLYEGVIDGDIRFLGRSPISQACLKVVITSERGLLVMLEDRSWVTLRMEDQR